MKLDLALLKSFITLPEIAPTELRHVFDDLGLEVEGIEDAFGKVIFNIETLAHRGDHLSALGIAREFAARYLKPLTFPDLLNELPNTPSTIAIKIDTEFCLGYSLLAIDLPDALQLATTIHKYLDPESGQHPIVQLSNFVLTELGQPTHAFDAAKLEGGLQVIVSTQEEEIIGLDLKKYLVPASSLLIKDSKKTVAVAGVIGCANSMVTSETKQVVIESAIFCPTHVRKTARAMGLSTDASYLFERGADIYLPDLALRRIAKLVLNARPSAFSSVKNLPPLLNLEIEIGRFRWHLNQPELLPAKVQERLLALGYHVEIIGEKLKCLVPSHRYWNVKTEACVIEDYCRTVGYNSIPATIPQTVMPDVLDHPSEFLIDAFEPILTAQGFNEVITRSYYSNDEVDLIAELDQELASQHLKIINSLEGAYSNLKLTNILHLAKVINRNLRFNIPTVKIYEFGRIFNNQGFPQTPYQLEKDFLTLAFAGRWYDNSWKKPVGLVENLANFSGVLTSLLSNLKIDFQILPSKNPLLHPGRQSQIVSNSKTLAVFGSIHPLLKDRLGFKEEMIFAEVFLDECYQLKKIKSEFQIIDYPPIKWDLTFKVPRRVAASRVLQVIEEANPQFLKSAVIVDSFDKPDENFTRISYRFHFQEVSRTLSNEEVDQVIAKLLVDLKEQHQLEIVS